MQEYISLFIGVFAKFIFLLTPFAVLTAYLSMTKSCTVKERQRIAIRTMLAIMAVCFVLYLAGRHLFALFGITLDAFRIGAGALLFLGGVAMARGETGRDSSDNGSATSAEASPSHDIAVVPLAIPVTVGPATIGALMVMGAELHAWAEWLVACAALMAAALATGAMLLMASRLEKLLGSLGLAIMGKITGLFLASLAAQIIFTGIKGFFGMPG